MKDSYTGRSAHKTRLNASRIFMMMALNGGQLPEAVVNSPCITVPKPARKKP